MNIYPWHSWIARETPTLEVAGSNPVGQAKKAMGRQSRPIAFLLHQMMQSRLQKGRSRVKLIGAYRQSSLQIVSFVLQWIYET